MRVESSPEGRSEKSSSKVVKKKTEAEKPEKTEKHAKKSSKKSGAPDEKDTEVTLTTKAAKATPAPTEKKAEPPSGATASTSPEDKELTQAELLMDHVNSGKLATEERDMAMKRVEQILKKYGKL